ncbi:MAG: glycosyltransferase family 25 protein [Planctomycetia bacterium]|nr:glycosyltransferase family 25 protein [Planctomycetia bacterium]
MKVFILTTKNRPERLENLLKNYPSVLPQPEIFQGFTPDDAPPPPMWWKPREWDQSAANFDAAHVWACAWSHLKMFELAAQKYPGEPILFLENDCVFEDDFETKFPQCVAALPENWGFFYAGGWHYSTPEQVNEFLLKSPQVIDLHCFMVSPKTLPALVQHCRPYPRWAKHHCDQHITQLFSDHPAYTPLTFIAGQSPGWSDLMNQNRPQRFYNSFRYKDLSGSLQSTPDFAKKYGY